MAVRVRDLVAGVAFVNAIPHTVMGMFGKRCLTPLRGEDSSASTNLAWAAMNAGIGAALLASGGWRRATQREADHRLVSVEAGSFAMLTFGMLYELTAGRRKRAQP